MPEPVEHGRGDAPRTDASEFFEPLRVMLLSVSEAERYRLLCSFFADLAQGPGPRAAAAGADQERLETLSRRAQRLAEEKALVDDALAAAKADLEHRTKQLEAEQQRSKELERIVGEQRGRLQATQTQITELEQQLTAKTAQLYEAENQMTDMASPSGSEGARAADRSGLTAKTAQLSEVGGQRWVGFCSAAVRGLWLAAWGPREAAA